MNKLLKMLNDQYAYEKERLKTYGQNCSMGKCAQSRIHLLNKIFAVIESECCNEPNT